MNLDVPALNHQTSFGDFLREMSKNRRDDIGEESFEGFPETPTSDNQKSSNDISQLDYDHLIQNDN